MNRRCHRHRDEEATRATTHQEEERGHRRRSESPSAWKKKQDLDGKEGAGKGSSLRQWEKRQDLLGLGRERTPMGESMMELRVQRTTGAIDKVGTSIPYL